MPDYSARFARKRRDGDGDERSNTSSTRPARDRLRAPPPFDDDAIPARQRLGALARMCRYLGVPLTARLLGMLPGNAEQARTIASQRRDALLPVIRGLLFEGAPLPTSRRHEIQAPTLIFGHRGDRMHPLRSGELLRDSIPKATRHVADSRDHWQRNPEAFCELVAAFVRTGSPPETQAFSGNPLEANAHHRAAARRA